MTDVGTLDRTDLEARVKLMYEQVATAPDADFHFETGRGLAEHLGYPSTESPSRTSSRRGTSRRT